MEKTKKIITFGVILLATILALASCGNGSSDTPAEKVVSTDYDGSYSGTYTLTSPDSATNTWNMMVVRGEIAGGIKYGSQTLTLSGKVYTDNTWYANAVVYETTGEKSYLGDIKCSGTITGKTIMGIISGTSRLSSTKGTISSN